MPPTIRHRLQTVWQGGGVPVKAISFAAVGAVNTVVDLVVFLFAYGLIGLSLVPANLMSWAVAVTGSYVLNSYTTFAAESGRKLRWRSYATFVVTSVAGAVGNTTALVVGSYVMPVLAAKVLAIGVSFLINFTISHFVVFRPARD